MPQMAPINWLYMYMLFILVFFFFIVMNYYSFLYKPKHKKVYKKVKSLNWKW